MPGEQEYWESAEGFNKSRATPAPAAICTLMHQAGIWGSGCLQSRLL